jgi:hypothetical protein
MRRVGARVIARNFSSQLTKEVLAPILLYTLIALHDLQIIIVSQELAAGLEKAQKFKQYQQQQMTGECSACVGTR